MTHPNAASNGVVSTSNEFAQIIGFLEGRRVDQTEGLNAMKYSGYVLTPYGNGIKPDYYTMSDEDAWEYFSSRYSSMLAKKKISSMSRLKYEANEYAEKYSEA